MNRIVKTARLQMNKPESTFLVPLYILGLVLVVSAVIVLAIQRGGGDPGTAEYVQGARMNMGAVWSLPGFIVYLGVQAVATTFPYAMALGATRRAFVFGTMITMQAIVYPLGMFIMDPPGIRFQVIPALLMTVSTVGLSALSTPRIGVLGPLLANAVSVCVFQVIPYLLYIHRNRDRLYGTSQTQSATSEV